MAISGIGATTVAVGGIVVYAGLSDQSVLDALRGVLKGELKPVRNRTPQFISPPGGVIAPIGGNAASSPIGATIASNAQKYVGRRYVWAGTFAPPDGGGDCSGLVYRAYRDSGIDAPRLNSLGFSRWRTRRVDTAEPGDLLWWSGHIAIATSSSMMVEAPTFGVPVRVVPIRRNPLITRYVQDAPSSGRRAV